MVQKSQEESIVSSQMENDIYTSRNEKNEDFPYGWGKGDTCCVLVTNKAKKSTCEYIVESYDGECFSVRSHTGLYHRVFPGRMFRTRDDAIKTLLGQERGGMSLQ